MKVAEVKKRAKKVGITPGKMKKAELVRAIQTAEGSNACFGRSNGQCSESKCCFIEDCLKIVS